jgi:Arc/MetJ family transcription regulator
MCEALHMATNLAIDPRLLEEAVEVSGAGSKKQAVTLALQEFIAKRKQRRLLDLFGTLEWNTEFDYKSSRSR